MRKTSQLLVSLAGLAVVVLIGNPATVARTPASPQTGCTIATATEPAEYWFFYTLDASNPSLVDPRSRAATCPACKVTRT
ncbi:MAG: hypothetical protein GZ085_07085 [Sulfuriferula multivorans]|uniref:Secreted protein n=1 Tax=Sulfuriferula multivorans TaxID=1559896 RepID=A0A7C9P369_9PROT|nr:hypothetical protein [Sulfuriferula multivorans]